MFVIGDFDTIVSHSMKDLKTSFVFLDTEDKTKGVK